MEESMRLFQNKLHFKRLINTQGTIADLHKNQPDWIILAALWCTIPPSLERSISVGPIQKKGFSLKRKKNSSQFSSIKLG